MANMTSGSVEKIDVAIIGAGWYGLVAARTFLRLRPAANILIIDSDNTVGGVWSKDRLYPNLVAQVKLGLFNYSDTPMPPCGGSPKDPRVTGEMIHDYMQKYAEDHDLLRRIRFNTFVASAQQCPGGWRLSLKDSDQVVEAEKLLVATGVTSIPNMPTFEENHDPCIPIIHSRDLGTSFNSIKRESVQNVVVVGAAKSAYDVVYLLLSMKKKVTWIIRSEGAGPLAILPFKILNAVSSISIASTRLMTHLSPSILNTRGPLYWIFQRTFLGRWCVRRIWDTLDYISSVHAGYKDGDHVSMLTPEIDRQSVFWAHSGLGVVTQPDFWETLHSTNLTIIRDEIQTIKDRTILLKSGPDNHADLVVMCTGWGDHFSMFSDDDKARIGLPAYTDDPYSSTDNLSKRGDINWASHDAAASLTITEKLPFLSRPPILKHSNLVNSQHQRKWRLYRRAIPIELAATGDRSLAILGQIHTVQTPLVSEVQSFWAILYLLGEIDLPGVDAMAEEVALWNVWTRRRYLGQGIKFPYSLYDFLPYIDSIFSDLGLASRRKSNPVAELFSPYHPCDFNGFIDEWLAKREAKHAKNKVYT